MDKTNNYSMRNITNDAVTAYIDERFRPIDQKMWRTRLYAEDKYIPIIQRDVEGLLVSLLHLHKPKRILEIGTAIGYSGSVMAKTLPEAHIVTLERSEDMLKAAYENFKLFETEEQMEVYEGDAREALDKLVMEVESGQRELFDFVFIDAAKSYYLEFFQKIRRMIKAGSVIVCDNTLMRGMTVDDAFDPKDKHRTNIRNMREFMDYITGLKDVHTSILPVGDGVTISYIKE